MLRISLTAFALIIAAPALAQDITIQDAFARASGPNARAGAAFFEISNSGASADRLVAVESEAAARVEIHTHQQDANGVMRMMPLADGIPVPPNGSAVLQRGGDHIMFMGLRGPFVEGESVSVTLVFENAGQVALDIPVDLSR